MSLFFVIAGFFARLLVVKLGPWGFTKHRLRRIGLPLLVAMLIVMPLTIVPLVVAVKLHPSAGGGGYAALRPQGGVPWGHLWFLYLLLVLSAAGIAGRTAVMMLDRAGRLPRLVDRILRALAVSRLLPVALAMPLGLTLYFTPWWQAWDGIPAPILGFVPNFPAVIGFGGAMLVGWFLHRKQTLLTLLARDWPIHLIVAIAMTTVACVLIGPDAQLQVVNMRPPVRMIYAGCYTLAIWSWCLGLIGVATAFCAGEGARWRYLADASFWIYLLHVPLVWGLQVLMMGWRLPWQVKYPLILAATVGLLLVLYRYLVRGTFIGQFLNGRQLPA
jgi:peptidoglycan/LPS O-acetylase OafA/YrhL